MEVNNFYKWNFYFSLMNNEMKTEIKKRIEENIEKTRNYNPTNLESECGNGYYCIELLGNIYCGLRMGEKIGCSMQARTKDHNGLYPCLNLAHHSKEELHKA